MAGGESLKVRVSSRYELALAARLNVTPEHRRHVRLLGGQAGEESGWIAADLMDLSEDGAGLMSTTFLPRRSRVRVCVMPFGGGEGAEPLLDTVARVERVEMTDGRPGYRLGVSFAGMDARARAQLAAMLNVLRDDAGGERA